MVKVLLLLLLLLLLLEARTFHMDPFFVNAARTTFLHDCTGRWACMLLVRTVRSHHGFVGESNKQLCRWFAERLNGEKDCRQSKGDSHAARASIVSSVRQLLSRLNRRSLHAFKIQVDVSMVVVVVSNQVSWSLNFWEEEKETKKAFGSVRLKLDSSLCGQVTSSF